MLTALVVVLTLLAGLLFLAVALLALAVVGIGRKGDELAVKVAALEGHQVRTDRNIRSLGGSVRGARLVWAVDPLVPPPGPEEGTR